MFSVDSAMNRYAGVASGTGGRAPERASGDVAVAPAPNPGNPGNTSAGNGARPSAVVNISAQGREQLARVAAAESGSAANAAGRAEPVRAVAQALVATNETNALQTRAADASADNSAAAQATNNTAADRADPNTDALARNAGPAAPDASAAQDRDGARVN